MANTQLSVLFIGALATAATYGIFYQFRDRWTGLLVEVGAAALWGLFALSSMNVIVRDAAFASSSEPIWPLVYLGVGMSLLALLYVIYDGAQGVGSEASEATLLGDGR